MPNSESVPSNYRQGLLTSVLESVTTAAIEMPDKDPFFLYEVLLLLLGACIAYIYYKFATRLNRGKFILILILIWLQLFSVYLACRLESNSAIFKWIPIIREDVNVQVFF